MVFCSAKFSGTARLEGKTAIITGSNTGIGKFTALDFYKRGCRVIMACRNEEKANAAREEIAKLGEGNQGNGELVVRTLDLSSLTSVRAFATNIMATEARINLLVNNAGVMATPKSFTEDGLEIQFGTNHLGHFLLTVLLLPRILNSTPARIVNLSSLAHESSGPIDWENLNAQKSYNSIKKYQESKLANVLFTTELARRLQGKGVTTYAIHPGIVKSDLNRHLDDTFFWGAKFAYKASTVFFKSEQEGAQTSIYCALDEKAGEESGLYYADCKKRDMGREARSVESAQKLWEVSSLMSKLGDFDPFSAPDQPPTN